MKKSKKYFTEILQNQFEPIRKMCRRMMMPEVPCGVDEIKSACYHRVHTTL